MTEDIEGSTEKLREIRDMGINIAIDDFGTGYSSLAYLTKLPVNALKIDRSFVDDMVRNSDSMNVVSAIISLAHSQSVNVEYNDARLHCYSVIMARASPSAQYGT